MKKFCVLALSFTLILSQHALAQELSVSGEVLDTVQYQDMAGATVRLLRDTFLVASAVAGPGGEFRFRHITAGHYRLSVSFQGYEPWTQTLTASRARVYMRPKSDSLGEVVIRDNRPVVVHGDTTSYKADQFHTRPNGMLEDLLKKLPGVDNFGGALMALGDTVQRILVNGNRFFGNNLSAALENLPRDVIERIEVFDDKSDQAKFSGVDDGIRIRTINVITRRAVNLGALGQVAAGVGTDGNETLYTGSVSLNHFKGKSLTSVLGSTNNTSPILGGSTRMASGGLNFSDQWGKSNMLAANYHETNSASHTSVGSFTENLLPGDSSVYNTQQQQNRSNSNGQSVDVNLNTDLDSADHVTVSASGGINTSSGNTKSNTSSTRGLSVPLNQSITTGGNNDRNSQASVSALWGRRFHKPRRSLSVSASGNVYDGASTGTNQYTNTYVTAGGDSVVSANQYFTGPGNGLSGGVSVVYDEPLGKHSVLNFIWGYTAGRSRNGRSTWQLDSLTHRYDQVDSLLTNLFTNTTRTNGGGLSYHYGNNRVQASLGANLSGIRNDNLDLSNGIDLKQRYLVFSPQASFYYIPKLGANFRFYYSGRTVPVPLNALQPLVNNSDPLHVTVGNPNLRQSFDHQVNLSYSSFNRKEFTHFFSTLHFSYTDNPVGNRSVLNPLTGADTTTYTNLKASYALQANVDYGWRLRRPASNAGIGLTFGDTHTTGYLNGILNASNNYNFGGSLQWTSNFPDHIDVNAAYLPSYNIARYSAEPGQNTHYFSQTIRVDGLWFPAKGNWQLGTTGVFTGYSGRPPGFNTQVLVWDASVSRLFFKRQQGELKLQAHDLLNQSATVSESFTPTTIQNTEGRMLGRYYLLSFIYHLKG